MSLENLSTNDIDLDNIAIEEYPNVLRERAEELSQLSPVGGTMGAVTLCTAAAELDYIIHGEIQDYEYDVPTVSLDTSTEDTDNNDNDDDSGEYELVHEFLNG